MNTLINDSKPGQKNTVTDSKNVVKDIFRKKEDHNVGISSWFEVMTNYWICEKTQSMTTPYVLPDIDSENYYFNRGIHIVPKLNILVASND